MSRQGNSFLFRANGTIENDIIYKWKRSLTQYAILEEGNLEYKIEENIGKGSFSNVFKVARRADPSEVYALKAIKKSDYKDEYLRHQLVNEIRNQRLMVNASNVIRIFSV